VPRRRFQEGRVYQRGKTQKWVGTFREDAIDPMTGQLKRVRRTVTFDSRVNSQRAARRALKPYLDAVNVDPPPSRRGGKTVSDLVEEWTQKITPNRKNPGARAAQSHIRTHLLPLLGRTPLRDLNTRALQAFVTAVGRRVNAQKSVTNIFGTLSSILRSGRKWGYFIPEVRWGDIEFPADRSRKQETISFDAETAMRIIKAASKTYRTILYMAAMTALRIGEITALKVGDLDFKNKEIHIRASLDYLTRMESSPKTKRSGSTVPMQEPLAQALRGYLATEHKPNPHGYLFVNRLGRPHKSQKVVQYGIHKSMDKLGIHRPKGVGAHCFRRGFSSELLSCGTPVNIVTRLMRHSDSKITLNNYGKILRNEERLAAERWAERFEAQLESDAEMESQIPQGVCK
jgi:integrase